MMRISRRTLSMIVVSILVILTVFVWSFLFSIQERSTLAFRVFDIGQGDSLFIETPDHYQILIDGGPDDSVLQKLGGVMPFWDRTIDLVVVTHPHADHITGLIGVLKRYHIGALIESGAFYSSPEVDSWTKIKDEKNIKAVVGLSGMTAHVGKYTILKILSPFISAEGKRFSNVHEANIVSELFYGQTAVLLTGDMEADLETQLITKNLIRPAQILKVGHHGSKTSTTEALLNVVKPEFAAISVGKDNRYGHPNQDIISRLKDFGIKIFRTDQGGDLTFLSDGLKFMYKGN